MDQEQLIQITIKKLMHEASRAELTALDEQIRNNTASCFFVQTITDYFTGEYQYNNANASRLFNNIKKKITDEEK
ncbi:hypothetical protein [Mucilaginibacter flavus]|uniref:hypothetical protein n=1 Tax=Mucilaginibacter flavus TaxID=931504 RepID=UPI0025B58AEA|nr:hypothetical protein [Mucilaginibacter flavus]MDN3580583.1 hypothetical protein [Mucilaginibacter flavus]